MVKNEKKGEGGLWTEEFGRLGATLKMLQDFGIKKEHLARLRSDQSYLKRVANFMICGGWEESVSQQIARLLLGNNFFGVEEWAKFFRVTFTPKQLREVEKFPWSAKMFNQDDPFEKKRFGTPKTIKETHFAFLGIEEINGEPLTILKLQDIVETNSRQTFSFGRKPWYRDEEFATASTCKLRWYLVPIKSAPNSEYKTFQQQIALLPPEYEVPLVIEEVMKFALYFLINNNSYPKSKGRGQETDSRGYHIFVQEWVDGIGIDNSYGNDSGPVGLAASRKIPQY